MIDATPDFREQLHRLDELWPADAPAPGLTGLFLTHGHMGHVSGLLHLGEEGIGAHAVPVWAMPRLTRTLHDAALWGRLSREGHIVWRGLAAGAPVPLSDTLAVVPLVVPHRGEAGETIAFRVDGPGRSVLVLPDIDGWLGLVPPIEELVEAVDVAYLDGTFYDEAELRGRDQSGIPHPTMLGTMERLGALPAAVRRRVRFTHLNHTNPALDRAGPAAAAVLASGYDLAVEGEITPL